MREHIAAWRQAFDEDDNSVLRTLETFAWNYAAFQAIAKAVDLAPLNAMGNKNINGMMLELLHDSYWGGVVLAIRRLVDPGKLHGKHGVSSIRSIVNDVAAKRSQLTRRAYIEDISELEYDYEAIQQRAVEYVRNNPDQRVVALPRELRAGPCGHRHKEFDFLSGVAPSDRSPNDLIRPEVFVQLEARLAKVDRIKEHATIHFAHASTEFSRGTRGFDRLGPGEAKEAFKLLVQSAELVGRWFVGSGVGDVLPHAQFDQFAHLDQPVLQTRDHRELQVQWQAFAAETADWPRIDDIELG